MTQTIGPIVFDLLGQEVSAEEREILNHPLIGGVILFTRNYESPEQLAQLTQTLRLSCKKPLLITVDQEGGRVQRFRKGFTSLPSMGAIGNLYDDAAGVALHLAKTCGWLMAFELLSCGVDLSFAPVLDLDKHMNAAIGDRAFHGDPQTVILLAQALMQGMREAGMASVGKHFPGHGSVVVDSHLDLPVDPRHLEQIVTEDLVPFEELMRSGLQAVMAAHILFPAVDAKPVGFSTYWLQTILREKLGFKGLVFSDALDMKGAESAGDYVMRTQAALEAGCDMALICNHRLGVTQVLDHLPQKFAVNEAAYLSMLGDYSHVNTQLKQNALWQEKARDFDELINNYQVEV